MISNEERFCGRMGSVCAKSGRRSLLRLTKFIHGVREWGLIQRSAFVPGPTHACVSNRRSCRVQSPRNAMGLKKGLCDHVCLGIAVDDNWWKTSMKWFQFGLGILRIRFKTAKVNLQIPYQISNSTIIQFLLGGFHSIKGLYDGRRERKWGWSQVQNFLESRILRKEEVFWLFWWGRFVHNQYDDLLLWIHIRLQLEQRSWFLDDQLVQQS